MVNNFLEKLTEWQNYLHYVLLAAGIVTVHYFLGIHYFRQSVSRFLLLIAIIFVIDTIVHAIFWFLPKPLQWRD